MSKRKRGGATKGENVEEAPLSHSAIWDDSALMDSWDAAYQEYKHYHSIAAKGEDVEEVLKAQHMKDNKVDSAPHRRSSAGSKAHPELCADHVEPTEVEPTEVEHAPVLQPFAESLPIAEEGANPTANSTAAPMHAPTLDHIQDEALKCVMMSWYYAGYYTGIYTEKQANQSKN
ncbi:hypothetical protein N7495_000605 [Penicillium taxi]|uniref:uncharacterized protein n=1 Tax=Penicillium taxi TaxID=168475 RepID=UPI002544F54F|nr:uncharacterized protein N7495_000605 [Penicillium taxi]KAJ5907923.1 hypothetical protein N7495_000605 [Penicillium taxi]